MALWVTRNMKLNVENKAKVSTAGAKYVPVAIAAAFKPRQRPRTNLGDIGNKVNEQAQARVPLKKEQLLGKFQLKSHPNFWRNCPDVDADDGADPDLCSEYVEDIYAYLRQEAEEQSVRPKYLLGREVTGTMRAILIDWLIQDNCVPKKMLQLQLVAVTAMFIASKYEEMHPPDKGVAEALKVSGVALALEVGSVVEKLEML
ncbi:G2/mitotic-specific cyclin-B1 [Microtus ochrogaster]|uniref:G2/mitotic-specific cyclin-B1 n=1 Tax=Microtus ochrogaster TaxID=79684 RepID=A0A8J6GSI1_MICOH|nr:G2/mitotic-specific cyclin-B1 [Microtus ochrogaster]